MSNQGSSFKVLILMATTLLVFSASYSFGSDLHSTLSTKERSNGGRYRRPWPCCDICGGCTKSIPAQCRCQDVVRSCHPSCKNCVRYALSVKPPMYQCMDRIPNYCHRRCSSSSDAISSLVGGGDN